ALRRARSGKSQDLKRNATHEAAEDLKTRTLGAQTGGRAVTPPHRKFKKNAPDRYEEMYERQREEHSSRRIRVEHGIAHLKNWRAPARTSAAASTWATRRKPLPACRPISRPQT
ncbi:hypothetical protein, partial [Streptomyces sp. NPDC012616]|uniref:hypothetical protein n=1 Tax=Streptomyces sp. NPDC012616 TaxID=3364840 RepID=UPI0036EB596A